MTAIPDMTKRAALAACMTLSMLTPARALDASMGEVRFSEICAACHNEGGIGTPGLAPPLNRPGFWSGLGDQAPIYIASVTQHGLNGTITAAGEKYIGLAMPPLSGLSDEELAAIGTWVLGSLGGTDKIVTTGDIVAARESKISAADLRAMRPKSE